MGGFNFKFQRSSSGTGEIEKLSKNLRRLLYPSDNISEFHLGFKNISPGSRIRYPYAKNVTILT